MNWIEIKEGCEMPEIGEPVEWRTENGDYVILEIRKDDYPWWNEGCCKCTHWRRIQGPDEQPSFGEWANKMMPVIGLEDDQDVLWNEVLSQLYPYFLREQYQEFLEKFKRQYTIIRK